MYNLQVSLYQNKFTSCTAYKLACTKKLYNHVQYTNKPIPKYIYLKTLGRLKLYLIIKEFTPLLKLLF